ncbi:hypothetical protein KFK09_007931 [Dendrobium nobile]|uniref:Uncharacterized protein n=1 Tax=Dendrobium nobile TaxID=94219 RepID=A0A8T3BT73_DENNO|nr:hypothetical protein KFK09_007931 [Dendrobium nobile]
MGYENFITSSHQRRYGSQPISVPFLWEQKPGMPKTDWNAKPIPFFATKFSKAKSVSSSETAIIPLSLVISVPFQWEEKPGKPLLMDKNPGSAVLPAPFPSCNPFINEAENVFDAFAFHGSSNESDSNQTESWYSVSVRDCQSDSSSSAMDNGEINIAPSWISFPTI